MYFRKNPYMVFDIDSYLDEKEQELLNVSYFL